MVMVLVLKDGQLVALVEEGRWQGTRRKGRGGEGANVVAGLGAAGRGGRGVEGGGGGEGAAWACG